MTASAAVEAALASLRLAGAPLIVMGFLVGLTTYTLYTLAISHANDRAKPHDMVAGLRRRCCSSTASARSSRRRWLRC